MATGTDKLLNWAQGEEIIAALNTIGSGTTEDIAEFMTRAETAATNAETSETNAKTSETNAKSWTVGPSSTETTGSDTNNAKYWAAKAESAQTDMSAQVEEAKGYATSASTSATSAAESASSIKEDLTNYYTKTESDTNFMAKKTVDSTPTKDSENLVTSGGVYSAIQSGGGGGVTFDDVPTKDSQNAARSGGIYTALEAKQDTLAFDSTPTADSTNPVTSGGIKTAIDAAALSADLKAKYDAAAEEAHTHSNKTYLDKIGEDSSGNPTYNGSSFGITLDDTPTAGSSNAVKSSGLYTALAGKQATLTFDSTPTESSNNPVTSGGIYDYLKNKGLTIDTALDASSTNAVTNKAITTGIEAKLDKSFGTASAGKVLIVGTDGVVTTGASMTTATDTDVDAIINGTFEEA